jgi:transposase InsO family protein
MDADRSEQMAYFRYGIINPLLSQDSTKSLKNRMREQAGKIWTLPNGKLKTYSWMTIEQWYYDYRNKGFSALMNPVRKDKGKHRGIGQTLGDEIDTLIRQYPSLKSSNIIAILDEKQLRVNGRPSDSTLYRYLRAIRPSKQSPTQERRSFEAPYAGNLWQADIMYGPYVNVKQLNGSYRKQQTYLVAIIDDHSRLLCHAEFYLNQALTAYIDTLKKAVQKRGIPERIYCDNGQVFLSPQIKRIGAHIGTSVVHTAVRDASAKGKIERFFKSLQDAFLNRMVTLNPPKSIQELNQRFWKWMEEYNNKFHSVINSTPMQRWLRTSQKVRVLTLDQLTDHIFLLETSRKVKKDGTFSLQGTLFETSWGLAGKSVTLRYDPLDLTQIYVYHQKQFLGKANPLNRQVNFNLPRIKRNLHHES